MSKERVAGCPAGWKESLNGKNWELTTWFRVTCWRKLAEAVNQYLEKGSQVFVEGELRGDASDGNQSPRICGGMTLLRHAGSTGLVRGQVYDFPAHGRSVDPGLAGESGPALGWPFVQFVQFVATSLAHAHTCQRAHAQTFQPVETFHQDVSK